MSEIVELGTISSRGQVAIPFSIREEMGLEEGAKVLFVLAEDTLLVKKVTTKTFAEITRPLKEAARQAGWREEEVLGIIHRARKKK